MVRPHPVTHPFDRQPTIDKVGDGRTDGRQDPYHVMDTDPNQNLNIY